ncbi:MAG: DsrE/DsrF/DrsH-like family protein [Planctomycetes bacterium]|nr:DsrE/DsrF/DrsH-like family protein [Planctomycetota bacterium]
MSGDTSTMALSELQELVQREVAAQLAATQRRQKALTIVAFSGDMDKLLATLMLANTAAASGVRVQLFFTFWGVAALRRRALYRGKGLCARMLTFMLPSGANKLGTSKMNMLGIGPRFFRYLMRHKKVDDVPAALLRSRALGVRLLACTTSMDLMGIGTDELVDGVECAGAPTCLQQLLDSDSTLFI